ncbi:MAG: argininosuccinate lyase [Deltaproteobacteria bacterium]|nr:argininosuccinate lyase [Deltaproteobacteria bacterium]
MSGKLWDKGGVSDAEMMRYTARDDWRLDQALLPFDLRATRAHVRGLARIGVVSSDELGTLEAGLDELDERYASGDFQVTPADEDCHSAIEAALVSALGEAGKKVHTGRSRNDQVLVALRLFEKNALDALLDATRSGALALLDLAEREAMTPMPGYTHLQRAVPSSVGLWAAGVAESLLDAREALHGARAQCDRCPLGTAAGYGVNLTLDREGVARELGFADLCLNPVAAQASRGAVEVAVLTAAWQVMTAIRRFAWDLSLFTTAEFAFVRLDEALTTGSSIMPNKRNPDVVELMRAACGVVQGAIAELMGMLSLPSGYQRDLQLTKAPLLRGLDEALATARMVPRVVAGMTLDRERMRAALSPDCFATDRAVELALAGVPFRDAYRQVAKEIATLDAGDADRSLRERTSPGACGDLRLDALRARLDGR